MYQWVPNTRTYQQQLYSDTGCFLEDLPGAIDDKDEWRESGKSMLAANAVMMIMMIKTDLQLFIPVS